MRIATMLDKLIGYFSDAVSIIVKLDRNQYPKIGVQPFNGDVYKSMGRSNHHRRFN